MWRKRAILALATGGLLAAPAAPDDISSREAIVCALQMAASCDLDGDCLEGVPQEWNIPDFIVIDLESRRLSTPASAPRPRVTQVRHLERAEGTIFLQGVERGRAYSIVIEEDSGLLSATVSTPGFNVSLFGACTGLPVEVPAAD